jgi:hypothetical protein
MVKRNTAWNNINRVQNRLHNQLNHQLGDRIYELFDTQVRGQISPVNHVWRHVDWQIDEDLAWRTIYYR